MSRKQALVEVVARGGLIHAVMPMTYDGHGCPCSQSCCAGSTPVGVVHECDDGFCEECYATECLACGASCCCDL